MGAKITIDSSTLMNKGLEVIEAHELFGVDFDRIDVVVHPQSIVHSMVEFVDGATDRAAVEPDMRLPIGLALGAPDRLPEPYGAIDWTTLGELTFEVPDLDTFRCLALAYEAGRAGGHRAGDSLSCQRGCGARRSSPAASRGPRSPQSWKKCLSGGAGNADEVADVLDADRRARERAAAELVEHEEHGVRADPFERVEVGQRKADPDHGCCGAAR